MTPFNLFASGTTILVGGAVATGMGFALKPSSPDQAPFNEQATHSYNYLVFSRKNSTNASATTVKCVFETSCKLFNWQSKELLAEEYLKKIKPDNAFVLNIENATLQHNQKVEVDVGGTKQLFVVQSKPNYKTNNFVEPIMPSGLMQKHALIAQEKTSDGIKPEDLRAIQTRRFLNSLEPTYIERQLVNHDAYVIFEWKTDGTILDLYTDTTDATTVDKHIFRTIEDQKKHKDDDGYLLVGMDIHLEKSSFVEIYEIKDQANIKAAIESIKKPSVGKAKIDPNWEALSKESLMITKLSQLEEGKFYKLVIENFSLFQGNLAAEKTDHLNLYKAYSHSNTSRLMRLQSNQQNYFCVKFPTTSNITNKCTLFTKSS